MRDEDYIDGIKLPTEQDIPWETVSTCGGTLFRMKIIGGYLYLKTSLSGGYDTMCFVPDNKELNDEAYKLLLNEIATLSMKLNNMQDSLREFEKEKFKPLEEYVILTEKTFNWFRRERDLMLERIHKLEEHHTRRIDENRKISKIIENISDRITELNQCYSSHRERIENLESALSTLHIGFNKSGEKVFPEFEGKNYSICNHEWYPDLHLSHPPKLKCKKCGNFKINEPEYSLPDTPVHPRDTLQLCQHGMPVKFCCKVEKSKND
jgi:hypothetical protein